MKRAPFKTHRTSKNLLLLIAGLTAAISPTLALQVLKQDEVPMFVPEQLLQSIPFDARIDRPQGLGSTLVDLQRYAQAEPVLLEA